MLSFNSLIFALIIVGSVLEIFNKLSGKELDFSSLLAPQFIIGMIILTLVAGLISGIYPLCLSYHWYANHLSPA